MDGHDLVANELVTVAGNNCQVFGCQVEVDTVHHGAQLVLCRSEDGAVDVLSQQGIVDDNLVGGKVKTLRLRELVGILDRQREETVLIGNLGNVRGLVNIESDGLLGETLHGFQQVVVANAETGIAVALRQVELGFHHILTVGGCQIEHVVVDVEQEVCQNGQ